VPPNQSELGSPQSLIFIVSAHVTKKNAMNRCPKADFDQSDLLEETPPDASSISHECTDRDTNFETGMREEFEIQDEPL